MTMDNVKHRYWFPAKRYGWGWGLPVAWQGWIVLVIWLAIVVPGALLALSQSWAFFYVFLVVMAGILIAICYAKGEPPRWRWGGGA